MAKFEENVNELCQCIGERFWFKIDINMILLKNNIKQFKKTL